MMVKNRVLRYDGVRPAMVLAFWRDASEHCPRSGSKGDPLYGNSIIALRMPEMSLRRICFPIA
jgi:hypothetical protein